MPSSSPVSATPATASSVAAPEAVAGGNAPSATDPAAVRWRRVELGALAAVIVTVALVGMLVRRDGHWWGDDWALYLRQADGLLQGRVGEVVADNRFTVETSGLPEFSPPMYPWGYPILLVPFVAVVGTDLDRVVVSQVVFLCWFTLMWYRLARPRIGPAAALVGAVVVGLSPQYLRWVEFVQSEIAFLAVTATALVLLDRERTRAAFAAAGASWAPLIVVGVAAGAAFSVRKEGLALVAAIGVAQLIALATVWRDDPTAMHGRLRSAPAPLLARLAAPHLAFVAVVGGLEALLPSTLVPSYTGNGVHNVWGFASDHLGHVAAQLGLRHVWEPTPTVFGNAILGWFAIAAFVVAVGAGIAVAVRSRPRQDLPLVAFAVAALVIGGSFRYPGSRYVATIGPIALLIGAVGVRAAVTAALHVRGRSAASSARRATTTVVVVLGLLAGSVLLRAAEQMAEAAEFRADELVQWGPEDPAAVQMFAAVAARTGADDVVAFAKARAMTQRTDRRAVQLDQWHPLERTIDHVTVVVVEHGDPVVARMSAGEYPGRVVWSNTRYVVYRVDPSSISASAATNGAGSASTASP